MRFTIDGSLALEDRIEQDMLDIRGSVLAQVGEENLAGLVLGGGYGRGEGGVYVVDGEEKVYNDYDFYVVVPFKSPLRRRCVARQLAKVKADVEPGCGIHVDFGPPTAKAELPQQPYELMLMELKEGYYVLYGPEGILDSLPDYDVSAPPLEEGARLFMNRGVGLLMAEILLREERALNREEHEFAVRNTYKAMMAMGDGVLMTERKYHPSYSVRRERVSSLAPLELGWWPEMQAAYANALEFKFHPCHDLPDGQSLRSWFDGMCSLFMQVFLWYERNRLANSELDWSGYMSLPTRLPVLNRGNRMKNIYRNIRKLKGEIPPLSEFFLHPRDRILKRLPGLLIQDEPSLDEEALVLRLWETYG